MSLSDGPRVPLAFPERVEIGASVVVALVVGNWQTGVRIVDGNRVFSTLFTLVRLVLMWFLVVVVLGAELLVLARVASVLLAVSEEETEGILRIVVNFRSWPTDFSLNKLLLIAVALYRFRVLFHLVSVHLGVVVVQVVVQIFVGILIVYFFDVIVYPLILHRQKRSCKNEGLVFREDGGAMS